MASAPTPIETLADLMERLGDIPLDRVRFMPHPGSATEEDVLAAEAAPRKRLCELIDGVLVEKPMGFLESLLAMRLGALLSAFVDEHHLGIVVGADGMMRLRQGRVRIPDVAFISWERLPQGRVPREPIPDVAPDIAAEILSRSNTTREMALKREDYFAAGVRIVWEIDPQNRTVAVYTSPENPRLLTEADALDGGDVLPGYSLSLAQLFAELDRQA